MAQPFHGTYADLKVIKGRKVAQLIIEMPLEAGDKFVKDYGLPNPAEEVWFAVAQLDLSKAQQQEQEARKWDQVSAAQQAGIRCGEGAFWKFLREEKDIACTGPDVAAQFVRDFCDVDSRSALKPGTAAEASWLRLDGEYLAWRYSS